MMRLPLVAFALIAGVAVADDAAAKKFLKELEGDYTPVSMTRGGDPAPDEFKRSVSFVIKGDTFIVRFTKDGKAEDKAGTLFTEEWEVAWAPKVEGALIEESIHGDSVETAALAKLVQKQAGPMRTTLTAADYRRQGAMVLARRLLFRLTRGEEP